MPAYHGEYERELMPFLDSMRVKLAMNKHKGKWEDKTIDQTLNELRDEVEELAGAIKRGNTIEMLLEAADVSNLAMIAFNIALKKAQDGQTTEEFVPCAPPADPHRLPNHGQPLLVDPDRVHYAFLGYWVPHGDVTIFMWKHCVHGYVVYGDHEKSRKCNFAIAPWTVEV